MKHIRNLQPSAWTGGLLDRRQLVQGLSLVGSGLLLSAVAGAREVDGTVVETRSGKVRGRYRNGVHSFKGIAYGADTAGANRFMAPVKPIPWPGIRDAFHYGHQTPQAALVVNRLNAPQADPKEGYSENCLVLNVWTPGPGAGKRPVMFWIHGGGFSDGSGSWPWTDGEALARRSDVVVVSINHRLNVLGFLHLGDIGGEQFAASGNAGMLDLVAGLEWVRDNIAQFGGDPHNVMLFGQSGGGGKICTLLAMPSAKGLFHRAAIQSGAFLRVASREDADRSARAVLKELGIAPSRVTDLQRLPLKVLQRVKAGELPPDVSTDAAVFRGYQPVVDGHFLPAQPFDPVAPLISADVPLLVGCTQFETTISFVQQPAMFQLDEAGLDMQLAGFMDKPTAQGAIDACRKDYPHATPSDIFFLLLTDRIVRLTTIGLMERKVQQGSAPVYGYSFAWNSPADGGRLKSPHTVEIPFVFHNTDVPTVMTRTPTAGALADKTSDAWVAFARSGNPNHKALPPWPAYDLASRATMVFDDTCAVVPDPGGAMRQYWAARRHGSRSG